MSNVYFEPKRVRLWSGFVLNVDGTVVEHYFGKDQMSRTLKAPVTFQGQPGILFFGSHGGRQTINHQATALIVHPGLAIYGQAFVTTHNDLWHRALVDDSVSQVEAALEHLAFEDDVMFGQKHSTLGPCGLWGRYTNVFARSSKDFSAIRLAL